MKNKFNIDEVMEALSKSQIDETQRGKVVSFLKSLSEEEKERQPRAKKQFVGININESIYVVSVPEEFDPNTLIPEISLIVKNYNENLKPNSRKSKMFKLVDVFESMPAKLLKEKGISVINKTPLWMIESENIVFVEQKDN